MLTRQRIFELFEELNSQLKKSGIRGDVFAAGGAVMITAYDARPATRDIDTIWQPSIEVRQAAERIASLDDDIGPDWLNDGVKILLSNKDPEVATVVYENDHLTVSSASAQYLPAMKLLQAALYEKETTSSDYTNCVDSQPSKNLNKPFTMD